MDEAGCVRRIRRGVAQRLGSHVVERLLEDRGAGRRMGDVALAAAPPVAAHELDRVRLQHVLLRHVGRRDRAEVDEGNRDRLLRAGGTDVERQAVSAGEGVLEAELEGQILDRIAVVVDMDLVERLGIEHEEVRPSVVVLQRHVVRDHRAEGVAARLVAAEQVEIGGVLGDEGRFAVARGQRRAAQEQRRRGACCPAHRVLSHLFPFRAQRRPFPAPTRRGFLDSSWVELSRRRARS